MTIPAPQWTVVRSLGHIGVAEVAVVQHPILGDEIVRKRFDVMGMEDSIAFLEPQILHEIDHPNVVNIHDALLVQEDPFPVVEILMPYYADGSVLRALTDGPALTTSESVRIARDIASALTYIHNEVRAVHRDVKPANILLENGRQRALLSDFGSAARLDTDAPIRTLGRSPLYQDPSGSVETSDIYALGLTLFEMLNGPFPYAEFDFAEVQGRLDRGLRAMPNRLLAHRPWTPRPLRRIVNRAINARPDRRFQSAIEFRTDLRNSRYIDWRRTSGIDLEGRWEGIWQGRRETCTYVVETRFSRGRLRASAKRMYPSGWRQFGIPSLVSAQDEAEPALTDLFVAVEQAAANHAPA